MSLLNSWVIPGVVAIAAVTGISLYSETEKMEADLTERANALLASKDMEWASISFDGRDATLTGTAPEEGVSSWLVELLDVEWGIRVIDDRTDLLTIQKPYTWGLERAESKVSMIGYMPYEMRKSLPADMAGLVDGSEFSSSAEVARGAPQDFKNAVGLAADLVKAVPNAKVMLIDDQLTFSGALEDGNQDHVDLFAQLKEKADNADLGSIALDFQVAEPKPPVVEEAVTEDTGKVEDGFAITRTDTGVDLAGVMPSADIKTTLLDLAKRKFGSAGVSDNLSVQEGEKIAGLGYDDYNKTALAALQAVSRLGSGSASLTRDGGLSVSGGAFYQGALDKLLETLNGSLPGSLVLNSGLSVAEPGEAVNSEECQTLLKGALEQNTILFDSGKATISSDSFGLLDGLIYTAMRCPDSKIQIEGHTDSDGNDAANQALSERRAGSVVGYLVEAGLGETRLEPKGFGEANPVADNKTPEGKAKNRRIEFVILAQ